MESSYDSFFKVLRGLGAMEPFIECADSSPCFLYLWLVLTCNDIIAFEKQALLKLQANR